MTKSIWTILKHVNIKLELKKTMLLVKEILVLFYNDGAYLRLSKVFKNPSGVRASHNSQKYVF